MASCSTFRPTAGTARSDDWAVSEGRQHEGRERVPKELKGKKIATTGIAAVATFMLKQILTKHGLDGNKDMVYIDPGLGNQLTALMSGVADAAVVGPELRYIGLDKGMKDLFYYGNEVKNFWGTLATSDRLIKE